MTKKFKMKSLSLVYHYLSIKVTKNRINRTLHLSQRIYIEKMLTQFELIDCKSVAIFINKQSESASNDYKASKKDILLYQFMIDFLIYVMMKTRLDIAFAIDRLSQFNINFTSQHLKAVKHVLKYLKETLNLSITYDDDDYFIEYTNVD